MIREACFLSTLVKDGLKREKRKNTYFQSLLNGFLFPLAQCKKKTISTVAYLFKSLS